MGVATGGAASAWFAGSSRIPFVAGLTSALPAVARPRAPAMALAARRADDLRGAAPASFTALSLVGSSVAEAYQVLLKAAVVIQLIPFVYLFLALARTAGVTSRRGRRATSGWRRRWSGLARRFCRPRT